MTSECFVYFVVAGLIKKNAFSCCFPILISCNAVRGFPKRVPLFGGIASKTSLLG